MGLPSVLEVCTLLGPAIEEASETPESPSQEATVQVTACRCQGRVLDQLLQCTQTFQPTYIIKEDTLSHIRDPTIL